MQPIHHNHNEKAIPKRSTIGVTPPPRKLSLHPEETDSTEPQSSTPVLLAVGTGILILLLFMVVAFLLYRQKPIQSSDTIGASTGVGGGNHGVVEKRTGYGDESGPGSGQAEKGKRGKDGTELTNDQGAPTAPEAQPVGGSDESDSISKDQDTIPSDISQTEQSASVSEQEDTSLMEVDEESTRNQFFTLGNPGNVADLPSHGESSNSSAGEGDRAEFFGVMADAEEIAYVIDMSSSMTGRRFETARSELIDSIKKLKRNQSFYVVFFHSIPMPQPENRILKATFKNKTETTGWIQSIFTVGGTDPTGAIQMAIQRQPDAIYLLSDGEFVPGTVEYIRQLNKGSRIAIHTIAFEMDATTLRRVAKENRGDYRHIP